MKGRKDTGIKKIQLDNRIDLFDCFFSSGRKGKLFCRMKDEYELDKEYFLKRINIIVTDNYCRPENT
jgi:hypothetical protein